jgi:phage terminase small subunit
MKEKKLTKNALKKYCLIIDEWFNNDFNGKQAYLKFYKNVKDDTASTNFSKIQQYPEVKEYIKQKYDEAAKVVKTTHEGILRELVNWVQSDITETMCLTPEQIKELPIELKRLINKFDHSINKFYNQKGDLISTTETVKLGFVSKERAIEMINKHVGFYEVDNQQKAAVINITTSNDKHKALVEGIMNGEV